MNNRKQLIENIIESIYAIRKKISAEMHLFFTEAQITHSQWLMLHIIEKKGALSIKEIASLLGTTSSAATQLVDSLVNKGLAARKRNPRDRRVLIIELTAQAKKQFESIKSKSFDTMASLFDALGDDELLKYFEINNKIITNISKGMPRKKE